MAAQDPRWSLKGMTALVTGGTRGIGKAIVEELASFGAIVHTCALNEKRLNERLEEWKAKGYTVTGSICDLYSKPAREDLMKTVSSLFDGKLNILVNNAGAAVVKPATEVTTEDYSTVMGTNFDAPFHLCQLGHPLLKASGNGSIVFISSNSGHFGVPYFSMTGASKGALNQVTKNLAVEWVKDNIRVNAISPAMINTAVSQPSELEMEVGMRMISRTPMGRIGEPNEVSPLVTFLCLPVASYITGQIIGIDGGLMNSGW